MKYVFIFLGLIFFSFPAWSAGDDYFYDDGEESPRTPPVAREVEDAVDAVSEKIINKLLPDEESQTGYRIEVIDAEENPRTAIFFIENREISCPSYSDGEGIDCEDQEAVYEVLSQILNALESGIVPEETDLEDEDRSIMH